MIVLILAIALLSTVSPLLIGVSFCAVSDANRQARVDLTASAILLLSLLGFVISLLFMVLGLVGLAGIFATLSFTIAVGKLFAGGVVTGAGGYVADSILKRRNKKGPTTVMHPGA